MGSRGRSTVTLAGESRQVSFVGGRFCWNLGPTAWLYAVYHAGWGRRRYDPQRWDRRGVGIEQRREHSLTGASLAYNHHEAHARLGKRKTKNTEEKETRATMVVVPSLDSHVRGMGLQHGR